MKHSVPCLLFLSCLVAAMPLYAGSQTLSTYYPAPNGDYRKVQASAMQLVPSTQTAVQALYNCSFVTGLGLGPCPAGLIYFDSDTLQLIYSNGSQWETLSGVAVPLDIGGYHMTNVMNIDGISGGLPQPSSGCYPVGATGCNFTAPSTNAASSTYSTSLKNGDYFVNSFNAGTPTIDTVSTSDSNDVDLMYGGTGPSVAAWRVQLNPNNNAYLEVNLQNLPRGTVLITYTGSIDIDQFFNEYLEEISAPAAVRGYYPAGTYAQGTTWGANQPTPPAQGITVYLQEYVNGNWTNIDASTLMTDTVDPVTQSAAYDQSSGLFSNMFSNASYYTHYSFSRTYSVVIGAQPKTAHIVQFRLVVGKQGAIGNTGVACGTSCTGTAWSMNFYYDIPIAVRVNSLTAFFQFQQ